MRTTMKSVLAILAVLAAFVHEARAQCPHGSFVIRNPTSNTINYQVQWGDGDWKSYSVSPGCRRWHYHELGANGCAPTPRVRFDYIGGDGDVTYKSYRVGVDAVHHPENGKKHHFCYSRCGCYLYLYAD